MWKVKPVENLNQKLKIFMLACTGNQSEVNINPIPHQKSRNLEKHFQSDIIDIRRASKKLSQPLLLQRRVHPSESDLAISYNLKIGGVSGQVCQCRRSVVARSAFCDAAIQG